MKYDNSVPPRPDELKMVENRLDDLVDRAYKNQKSDPESSMNNARKAAEAICRYTLIKNQLIKPDNTPRELDQMLVILRKHPDVMPKKVELHVQTLQKWGNAGSHFETMELTTNDIASALLALKSLVEWFYTENDLNSNLPPNPLDTSSVSQPEKPRSEVPPVKEPSGASEDDSDEELFHTIPLDFLKIFREEDNDSDAPELKFDPKQPDADKRRVTTNFHLDLSVFQDHGTITFRSPDSILSSDPAYAAVKDSYFFDLSELFEAIRSFIILIMRLNPEDITILYKDPGEWQACAPEFPFDGEDSDDGSPESPFSIPFNISYRSAPKNKRTEGFALYLNSCMIHEESLQLFFNGDSYLHDNNTNRILTRSFKLKPYLLRQTLVHLIRLAHPVYCADIKPEFTVPEDRDYGDPMEFNLRYTLETYTSSDPQLFEAMYERDDAKAELREVSSQRDKLSRWLSISLIVIFVTALALTLSEESWLLTPIIGILLCLYAWLLMYVILRP